jgi:phosphotransferase system HPr (HPr) family protein
LYSERVTITNIHGLHARPATLLVNFCRTFSEDITIKAHDKCICAKSIISVLSGALTNGLEVEIAVEGNNEEAVCREVIAFIRNLRDSIL